VTSEKTDAIDNADLIQFGSTVGWNLNAALDQEAVPQKGKQLRDLTGEQLGEESPRTTDQRGANKMNINRIANIMNAQLDAIGDRDPKTISAGELFVEISKAVPDVTHEEVVATSQHFARLCLESAQETLHHANRAGMDGLHLLRKAPDRAAIGIAFEQGKRLGLHSDKKISKNAPSFYGDGSAEAEAWILGIVSGKVMADLSRDAVNKYLKQEVKAGRLEKLGGGWYRAR
jgi:hypothetical protein